MSQNTSVRPSAPAARLPLFGRVEAPGRAKGDSQSWMTTFTDLVALMLTFFVLLFSMSRIDTREFQNLSDALASSLNSVDVEQVVVPSVQLDIESASPTPGTDLDYLRSVLEDQIKEGSVLAGVAISRQPNWLVISLPADLLFAPGSVEPTKAASEALFALCGVLRRIENRIEVVGHADPSPPGAKWRSNWQLSLGRGLAVAAKLQRTCYSGAVTALGQGDTRFADLPPDLPARRRQALARRVDIAIHENAWNR